VPLELFRGVGLERPRDGRGLYVQLYAWGPSAPLPVDEGRGSGRADPEAVHQPLLQLWVVGIPGRYRQAAAEWEMAWKAAQDFGYDNTTLPRRTAR
jgi:hypothetical protein